MKNKKKILAALLSLGMFLLVAPVVFAQDTKVGGPEDPNALVDLVEKVAGYFQMIVLFIAVIMIIYAGFTWMTAAGDEEKLTKARKTLIWGLIGIAVALFAYVAESFVANFIS